jgi:hypothetical protein
MLCQVTPKCAVYPWQGARWEADGDGENPSQSFDSMVFTYQPKFDENGQQHPMEVEFSVGITTAVRIRFISATWSSNMFLLLSPANFLKRRRSSL